MHHFYYLHVSKSKKIAPVHNLNADHSNLRDPEISSTLSINKSKAKKLRLFAFLSWFLAIGIEVAAYFILQKTPSTLFC